MAETKYTQAQIDALIAADDSLGRTAKDKYADYKSKDPFPDVGEALLNSVDLLMYLLTVGIVEPFDVKKLKGETYQCAFSGEVHYYDTESGKMIEKILKDEEEFVLGKNSITYLKIEEKYHVPEYMVLRFNLSVSNAYKGVLLGTGPIVDSGFEGSLFIPLHNLTGNDYIIKKGAPLIRVEFTKLSTHSKWNASEANKKSIPDDLKPITKKTPQNAGFSVFFDEALLDSEKKMFYSNRGVASVRSSIPDAIADAASRADEAHCNAESSAKEAKAAADTANSLRKEINTKLRNWSIVGGIGALLAVAAVLISVYSLIHDTISRYDGIVQEIKDYKQQIYTLEQEVKMLQEKPEQYEITQTQSSELHSGNITSDETDNPTPASSIGTETTSQ